MVAPGLLDKVLTGAVNLGWVAVHAAEELAFDDVGDGRGARVAVGRGGAGGGVVEFEADNGFAGAVGEGVVIEDFELFAGAFAGGRWC